MSIENPLHKAVLDILAMSGMGLKAEPLKKGGVRIRLDSEVKQFLATERAQAPQTLEKAIVKALNHQGEVERLAFEADPTAANRYSSLYKAKQRLIPDKLLKRIVIQDDLVAAIVQVRQNHVAAFGRPRPDRFSTGFVVEAMQETLEAIEKVQDPEEKKRQKDELQRRIASVTKRIMTCGDDNLDLKGNQDDLTFPQYLSMSARNAIVCGRIATEVLYRQQLGPDGKKVFAGFRVIDAGTIYRAEPQQTAAEAVRRQAIQFLSELKNKRLDPDRFMRDEYAWVQVIDDRPVQAFTEDECLVHNFYPVPDVELDGYPVTPLDTVISAVTTHINITVHNKLYFQSGRAARGMIVIKSDDVDEDVVANVRQQFMAQINSVNNAWRMPVFGVGADDEITWMPIDSGGRDMEFQYLADMNARVILSAFQMSPEELPGWSYLSRGTNNQALSESNNEYRMEAARDVGIRPLLAQFEDFLNQAIMPLFDPWLAKRAVLKLVGLDAETAEKESQRLQQDMPVHMTFDEVLEKVEKKAVGKKLGGEFPLNPAYQAVLDKYVPVGVILEEFFGMQGASQDPQWAYVRDPFWFQMQQMLMMAQQQQQQAQAQAEQEQAGNVAPEAAGGAGGGAGGPGAAPAGEGAKPTQETSATEKQKSADVGDAPEAEGGDLTRGVDQALGALSKAERHLPRSQRANLMAQRRLIADFLDGWEADLPAVTEEILREARRHAPK